MLEYRIFSTAFGYVSILISEKGIAGIGLPCPSARGAYWLLGKEVNQAVRSEVAAPDLVERLKLYFEGKKVEFPDELDLSEATPFRRRIWQASRDIPYGETRSYGWVAAHSGNQKASRAAGQALGKNPIPIIIPCHRVIAGDGGLGGFSSGLNMKQRLLAMESSGK